VILGCGTHFKTELR